MVWGDPFKDLDELGDDVRRNLIVENGLVPGSMVTYGRRGGGPVHVWTFPEIGSDSFDVLPSWGTIVAVDCESDPSTDWLFLLLFNDTRSLMCWVPSGLVTRVA